MAAEAGKGDVELEDEDLDAGAWGDPDLDLEPHEDGDANGEADIDRAEGDEDEDEEGGWEMEVLIYFHASLTHLLFSPRGPLTCASWGLQGGTGACSPSTGVLTLRSSNAHVSRPRMLVL